MAGDSGYVGRADPASSIFVGGKIVMRLVPKDSPQVSSLELASEKTADLLLKHGGKTGKELKADGK